MLPDNLLNINYCRKMYLNNLTIQIQILNCFKKLGKLIKT